MKMTVVSNFALCCLVETVDVSEAFTASIIKTRLDDGGSKHLLNICQCLREYMSNTSSSIYIYCNKFAGSVSQWKFTTLTVQFTTLDYSSQLF
jgi:hypothetical protein